MNTVAKKFALAALCTTALTGVSQAAVLFDIVGGGAVPTFNYGSAIGDNNVINATGAPATGSTVLDTGAVPARIGSTNGPAWVGSVAGVNGNAVLSVSGLTAGQGYTIQWTYIGNEASNQNVFSISGTGATVALNGVVPFSADNRNNNCCGGINPLPTVNMGATVYNNGAATVSTPGFTLSDISTGASTTNNGTSVNPIPNSGSANLIFAYLTPDNGVHPGILWDLTTTQTADIVFGFNDNGSGDDNHDDFMAIAHVIAGGLEGTPIPGALPLFGSVLGGGLLFRRLRKRKAQTTAA